jgi:ATP-dependent DNA helicase RecG
MFALREYGEVRVIGEGTQRIKREMSEAKLPAPRFAGSNHAVTVSLYNEIANRTNSLDSEAYKMLGEALSFSLDPDERRIVNFVIENKTIKPTDALRVLSTTYWQTARAKLQRLVDRGILDFHSAKKRDPNSYYTLRKVVDNGD